MLISTFYLALIENSNHLIFTLYNEIFYFLLSKYTLVEQQHTVDAIKNIDIL